MPLVTLADLRAKGPEGGDAEDPDEPVYEAVAEVVADPYERMPPRPLDALEPAEIQVLQAFAAAGAPESSERCADDGSVPDGAYDPPSFACDGEGQEPYDLLAHGAGPDGKFAVQKGAESYHCFRFRPSWLKGETKAIAVEPVVDDGRVLHHWLLYAEDSASGPDGSEVECSAAHPNAELLAGWAPGAQGLVMPDDVGLKLPTAEGGGLVLEVHYNNLANHENARDASGARICVTERPRKYTAGVHWLGTVGLVLGPGQSTPMGTCRPQNQEPVHIISQWPHMHNLGRHMRVEVSRASGGIEVLHDAPFSFHNQVSNLTPVTIQPGDVLRTYCTFQNDTGKLVTLGENTGDEMCFNFVTAYPLGALVSALPIGVSKNTCIEPL